MYHTAPQKKTQIKNGSKYSNEKKEENITLVVISHVFLILKIRSHWP